jgi:nucleolar protein 4
MPKSIENTVFVRLVPAPTHKVKRHELEDIFSQIGPVKKSSWINAKSHNKQQSADGENNNNSDDDANAASNKSSKGYGFVKYLSQQDAESASTELNNSKIQMEGKNYTLKVELASLSAVPHSNVAPRTTSSTTTSKVGSSNQKKDTTLESSSASKPVDDDDDDDNDTSLLKKKSRIIIRNLSFYAKEQHIQKVMEAKFGKVLEVHLPRVQKNLHVGFAFVTFQDPKDAQKAVTAKNVDISKRTVSMDWSLPKKVHQQQKQQQQEGKQQQKEEQTDETAMDSNENEDDDEALNEEEENGNSSSSDTSSDSDSDDSSASFSQPGSEEGEETDDNDVEDEEQEQHDEAVQKKCTLFLRNLPFDVSRVDVFQAFHRFGYITGTYLVKDKDTGMPKGTAFVTFSKPQSAQRALEFASTEGGEFVSQRDGSRKIDGHQHGENRGSVMIKDRRVFVDLAVDKETAATFDSKDDKIPSADRRNLYLQAEARVESSSTDPNADNTNTWDELPSQDQKRRQTALKDKTTKLQSPIFFINPNRLAIRNLAKHVDEAGLQQLCELAVKRGLENGLVSAKDQIAHMRALGEISTRDILAKIQEMERNNEDIIPGWVNGNVDAHRQFKHNIPSVYIARDFGPDGKKKDAPSRGFGFAEFTHHTHALACLRELNNNPAYSREYVAGGKAADAMKKRSRKNKKTTPVSGDSGDVGDFVGDDGRVRIPRLIVDFTVENKVKAKKQADRRLQQQLNRTKQHLENKEKKLSATEAGKDTKKRGRGAIQREKKRQRRESGEEEKERQAKLEAKAMAEAKKEMRKERQAQKQKQKLEDSKRKAVKPPKKKRVDEEDEKFDDIVRSYTSKLEDVRKDGDETNPHRAVVQEKRWFE